MANKCQPIRKKELSTHRATIVSQEYQEPRRRSRQLWSDFVYGAQHVNSRYLELFSECYLRKSLIWVAPVALLLATSHFLSPSVGTTLSNLLARFLRSVFLVSSLVGGVLQLPLDATHWAREATPAIIVPLLDHVPNKVAIYLVRTTLFLQNEIHKLSETVICSVAAILVWRPVIEEVQYRYFLNIVLRPNPRTAEKVDANNTRSYPSPSDKRSLMAECIPVDVDSADTPAASTLDDDLSPELKDPSQRRILISSLLFATTRLGWLCALPDSSVFSFGGVVQRSTSPYVFTVGFMQSVITHFSSHVLSDLTPLLQKGFMLLALHQSISTFFVANCVFAPLYQERGLAAAIGAHVAWTVGKVSLPIRLLWRCLPSAKTQSW